MEAVAAGQIFFWWGTKRDIVCMVDGTSQGVCGTFPENLGFLRCNFLHSSAFWVDLFDLRNAKPARIQPAFSVA